MRLFTVFSWIAAALCAWTPSGHAAAAEPLRVADLTQAESIPRSLIKTLATYQGIVNRDQPRLFLVRSQEDLFWLGEIEKRHGLQTVRLADPRDAFDDPQLRALCSGLIRYGKDDCEMAENVALTLAGLKQCAIFSGNDNELAEMSRRGFAVREDIRGRWKTNEEAQAWAFENLRPQCAPDVFAINRGGFKEAKGTDYMVQRKMFVLFLDTTGAYIQDGATIQRACLASYAPTFAYGFWSKEVPDIAVLSEYGHCDAGDAPNISVFSHLPRPEAFAQKTIGELPVFDPAKTFIFISFSQGDSLNFCQTFNLRHLTERSASQPDKRVADRYPFGLMHSTLNYSTQPIVPAALYDLAAAPGQWFSAKGYGYANPTTLEQFGFLDLYLKRSKEAMRQMGIVDFMLNDRGVEGDPDRAIVTKIARELQPRSIVMKHQLDPAEQFDDPLAMIDGVLLLPDPVFDLDDPDSPKQFDCALSLSRILESAKKRQFFWVFLRHTVTVSDLERLMDALAQNHPEIEILNPDVFIRFCLELARNPETAPALFSPRSVD